jgi:hypothetical protein
VILLCLSSLWSAAGTLGFRVDFRPRLCLHLHFVLFLAFFHLVVTLFCSSPCATARVWFLID